MMQSRQQYNIKDRDSTTLTRANDAATLEDAAAVSAVKRAFAAEKDESVVRRTELANRRGGQPAFIQFKFREQWYIAVRLVEVSPQARVGAIETFCWRWRRCRHGGLYSLSNAQVK